jgi:hypothetical protein
MAKTPARQTEEAAQINAQVNEGGPAPPAEPTPLERMTDLTRRVIAVPKSEVIKPKPKKRKRRH